MILYLFHFDEPLHHAQHYMGVTTNIRRRVFDHFAIGASRGAKLTGAIKAAGIGWRLAGAWMVPDGFDCERDLKRGHSAKRWCPICKPTRRKWPGRRILADELKSLKVPLTHLELEDILRQSSDAK